MTSLTKILIKRRDSWRTSHSRKIQGLTTHRKQRLVLKGTGIDIITAQLTCKNSPYLDLYLLLNTMPHSLRKLAAQTDLTDTTDIITATTETKNNKRTN